MRKLTLAAALAVLTVGAAGAADIPSIKDPLRIPDAVSTKDWTGIYFGIVGGPDFVSTKAGVSADDGEDSFSASLDGISGTGVFGEAQIGYDRQIGNVVIGAFGGLGISNAKTVAELSYDIDGDSGSVSAELQRDWHWLAGIRLGYLPSTNTLVYVAGGYTQADASLHFNGEKIGSDTFNGWFGEAGIETRIASNIYGRVSGRYTMYDEISYDVGGATLTADPEDLRVMIGLAIKLNTR